MFERSDKSHSFIRELLALLPFFILHLSSGLSGSFTTILIEHFRQLQTEHLSDLSIYETLLGTFEDYCPIFVAVFGGILQQVFGPKKILIAAGIPSVLSWILVAIRPDSLNFLLGSRLLSGFSNGLLTGNVYMVDVAPSKYIASFQSIEAASRSMGAILIFAMTMTFYQFGFRYVAIAASIFPLVGLIGIAFKSESPIFQERVKEIRSSVESQQTTSNNNRQTNGRKQSLSSRLTLAKEQLKIPIKSPAVYQPMMLIICALCIQHFSGFTFTKKFLLQVLKSPTHQQMENSSSLNETTPTMSKGEANIHGYDEKAYLFAMLINFIRFISNIMMANFLRLFRIRSLYFISLFSTFICLILLGFLVEDSILSPYFSPEVDQYLKVTVLAVHVFCVQFGLQTLPNQLAGILLPSSSKAILKGFIRAVQALTLIIFVTVMKLFPEYWSFWSMAIGLICVCPLLYIFVPELKNLGRTCGEYFFLPSQTLFYVVLPLNNAKTQWLNAFRKISLATYWHTQAKDQRTREQRANEQQKKLLRLESYDVMSKTHRNSTFIPDTLETINAEERLKVLNRERICFIRNILSQEGFLNKNEKESRVCIGRGPISFPDGQIRNGGIFLFNDLVIVARKFVQNRCYRNEEVVEFKNNAEVRREAASLTLKSDKIPEGVKIVMNTTDDAVLWEKYCNFCITNLTNDRVPYITNLTNDRVP